MRFIDADKLKKKAQKLSTEEWKTKRVARVTTILNQFIDWIDGALTIDAIEVVRCKDCNYHTSDDECTNPHWNIGQDLYPKAMEYDFCSYGDKNV